MDTIFNDGVLEAKQYKDGWVFIRWLQNAHGRLQKQLVRDLMCVERMILDKGLKGWLTSSELAHKLFHKFIYRVGARYYTKDAAFVWFQKAITKREDLYNVRLST